ncbi:hypothetical protein B0H13DRAFT_2552290 [Mycena leptocephala]|nr:hypothetical protein B0H13DRAFT_2552290 [Mycena leptocephala]
MERRLGSLVSCAQLHGYVPDGEALTCAIVKDVTLTLTRYTEVSLSKAVFFLRRIGPAHNGYTHSAALVRRITYLDATPSRDYVFFTPMGSQPVGIPKFLLRLVFRLAVQTAMATGDPGCIAAVMEILVPALPQQQGVFVYQLVQEYEEAGATAIKLVQAKLSAPSACEGRIPLCRCCGSTLRGTVARGYGQEILKQEFMEQQLVGVLTEQSSACRRDRSGGSVSNGSTERMFGPVTPVVSATLYSDAFGGESKPGSGNWSDCGRKHCRSHGSSEVGFKATCVEWRQEQGYESRLRACGILGEQKLSKGNVRAIKCRSWASIRRCGLLKISKGDVESNSEQVMDNKFPNGRRLKNPGEFERTFFRDEVAVRRQIDSGRARSAASASGFSIRGWRAGSRRRVHSQRADAYLELGPHRIDESSFEGSGSGVIDSRRERRREQGVVCMGTGMRGSSASPSSSTTHPAAVEERLRYNQMRMDSLEVASK